mmetsp:Transcript_38388/g.69576  ORF Transcript_38388/g.69576 Transcript_38388/m.69576 type:complete len:112 (+) Transcript_38388:479-814(+)
MSFEAAALERAEEERIGRTAAATAAAEAVRAQEGVPDKLPILRDALLAVLTTTPDIATCKAGDSIVGASSRREGSDIHETAALGECMEAAFITVAWGSGKEPLAAKKLEGS